MKNNFSIRNLLNCICRLAGGCLLILSAETIVAQCTNKITVLSGIEEFGCTTVEVTTDGDVKNGNSCGTGPYHIGQYAEGSVTFSFTPPVGAVTLDIEAINKMQGNSEEVFIFINGAPYFLPNPGNSGCQGPAQVSPNGGLIPLPCPNPICLGSAHGIQITHTINTLTIQDVWSDVNPSPLGVICAVFFCCDPCLADAGELSSDPLSLCADMPASLTPTEHSFIGFGNVLEYILFSDPGDTLGSILATSNTPKFYFNPTSMQFETPYYIAAMVGSSLNGHVDLTDGCLDLSNAVPVLWRPSPSVSFTTDKENVCVGECISVTAHFLGVPPFVLTYNTPTGNATNSFPEDTGKLEICVPANASNATFNLHAIELKDAFCTCR